MSRITNDFCESIISDSHYLNIRKNLIQWNYALKEGSSDNSKVYIIWSSDSWEVGLVKPGIYANMHKPNDFKPMIWHNKQPVTIDESFNCVYAYILELYHSSIEHLFCFLCLLIRDSFSLDYIKRTQEEIGSDNFEKEITREYVDKLYKYNPLPSLVNTIHIHPYRDSNDSIIPIEAFIQYIALIAVDEDVSYFRELEPYRGKVRNLLSYLDTIPFLANGSIDLHTRREPVTKRWSDIVDLLLTLSSSDYIISEELIENAIFPKE